MVTLQLPTISIQKVSNGYIVQWWCKNTDKQSANRSKNIEAVCKTTEELMEIIALASKDIEDLNGCY